MQLDFALMKNVELGGVMPNTAANLPGGERILIGGIVADEQNGFGLVELLHGEEGIGGAIGERGHQAGVVGGAMVIDVVGSEGGAREPLQQIIFFVGNAIRTDKADRFGPARSVRRL